jgi:hypothetical protein
MLPRGGASHSNLIGLSLIRASTGVRACDFTFTMNCNAAAKSEPYHRASERLLMLKVKVQGVM